MEKVLKRLNYTQEMKEQDKLWESEREDLEVMERLYNEIISEAKSKGFKGIARIYNGTTEKLIEIFETKEEMLKADNGEVIAQQTFGYCKPLIEELEILINNQ